MPVESKQNKKPDKHSSLIQGQGTEVRILHKYIEEYYKYTKSIINLIDKTVNQLILCICGVTLHATGCSDR